MRQPPYRAHVHGAAVVVLLAACSRAFEAPSAERAAPSPSGPASASPDVAAEEQDTVRSVYPAAPVRKGPAVSHFCAALQEIPPMRLAECRGTTPGVLLTQECERMLDAAVRSGAVTLSSPDVDRCVEATNRALAGCEWARGGSFQPPPECASLVHGTLAAGSRCRSSLECVDGLRCHGVGPTTAGRCGPPHDESAACGGSVDALAVYARENDYEARHPECGGWCDGRRCAAGRPPLHAIRRTAPAP